MLNIELAKKDLLNEIAKLQSKKELSANVGPDYYEPGNMEYYSFLQQMTMGGQEYRQQSMSMGGIQNFLCRNPCLTCLLFNLCCGGGCGTRVFCC